MCVCSGGKHHFKPNTMPNLHSKSRAQIIIHQNDVCGAREVVWFAVRIGLLVFCHCFQIWHCVEHTQMPDGIQTIYTFVSNNPNVVHRLCNNSHNNKQAIKRRVQLHSMVDMVVGWGRENANECVCTTLLAKVEWFKGMQSNVSLWIQYVWVFPFH